MNTFFDGYVHPSTTLKEFVDKYDNVLHQKVDNENIINFKSFNSTIACVNKFSFEKKFQQFYTIVKFKEVQEKIREVVYYSVYFIKRKYAICTYQVT
jgi:zinc finger SWIM domain-containing protein 3